MFKNITTVIFLLVTHIMNGQSTFDSFDSYFQSRSLTDPIFDIMTNQDESFLVTPSIPAELYNQIVLETLVTPCYYDQSGNSISIDFIGQLQTSGHNIGQYDDDGNKIGVTKFYTTIHPIGKLDIQNNNTTLLLAIRESGTVSVYAYNFDQSKKLVSAIQLLYLEANPNQVYYEHPLYDFRIESDDKIYQQYDGLDFYRERKYELQTDGHFKVVWENIVDR